jgi:hypothetical protein
MRKLFGSYQRSWLKSLSTRRVRVNAVYLTLIDVMGNSASGFSSSSTAADVAQGIDLSGKTIVVTVCLGNGRS